MYISINRSISPTDYTASVQPAPFCDATPANNTNINVTPAGSATSVGGTAVVGGVDLCSLIPFPDSVAAPKIHTMFASPDKGRHFGEGLHNEQVVFTACNVSYSIFVFCFEKKQNKTKQNKNL